jgi:hypothetical protein
MKFLVARPAQLELGQSKVEDPSGREGWLAPPPLRNATQSIENQDLPFSICHFSFAIDAGSPTENE